MSKSRGDNFNTMDLGDIIYGNIDKSSFVSGSTFLQSMVVVVPEKKRKDFEANYVMEDAKHDTAIVPGSAKELGPVDADKNHLFHVVLFHKFANPTLPRMVGGYYARKFDYDQEKYELEKRRIEELTIEKTKQAKKLLQICEILDAGLVSVAAHVKIIRVYIDSVLRFGIPPRFMISVLEPLSSEKKILGNLTQQFGEEDQMEMYGSKDKIQDSEDFYPFVVVPMQIGIS